MADGMKRNGYRLVSGGTDNHLMLVDVGARGVTGKECQSALDEADLKRYAETLNLDLDRFEAELASPEIQKRIDGAKAEGVRLQVSSTPSIFINGRLFREPAAQLSAFIAEELER